MTADAHHGSPAATEPFAPFTGCPPWAGGKPTAIDGPATAETHLSVVFFAGSRAYKVYKPIDAGFLDATTLERRLALCRSELEQNRRFAPDVYLGVAHLLDDEGTVHEHALVMRRLPAERRLARLLSTGEGRSRLREVAKRVAAVHAAAPRLDPDAADAACSAAAVLGNWRDNFAALERVAGSLLDRPAFERVQVLAERYLHGAAELFRHRIEHGMAIDGHGDLLAEDIFCLEDGPRILDCLAFDDRLRHGDVLADLAFLVMDVQRLAGVDAALSVMRWYQEFSNEHHPGSLAHHYVAYRAHVRAKVAAMRHAQGDPDAGAQVRDHHRLCLEHLERARTRFVLIGGAPATGKSTIAAHLGEAAGWTVLRSDDLRRERRGLPADPDAIPPGPVGVTAAPSAASEGVGEGHYRPDAVAEVYDALLDRARRLAAHGQTVVLDASWTERRWREAARRAAGEVAAELVELRCDAPPGIAEARLQHRRANAADASEATVEVARALRQRQEPWPEATTLDTNGPLERVLARALDCAR
jgi:aminoglycoside phosphotransferase family enzyme/predicted kinase